jgi:hypothetical protein
LSAIYCLFGGS